FKTAIDDFGEGYAGLSLLADFLPDYLKIDMNLVRNVHLDRAKKAILSGIISVAKELEITVIAEGVEPVDEYSYLRDKGIDLMQGFLFARPEIEKALQPTWQD